MQTTPGFESDNSQKLNAKEIVIRMRQFIIDNPKMQTSSLLGAKSKDDFEAEFPGEDYYESLAIAYLENVYNESSDYSVPEHMLYLAGAYSRQVTIERMENNANMEKNQPMFESVRITLEGYNQEKNELIKMLPKGGAIIKIRIGEIDKQIEKIVKQSIDLRK